MTQPAAAYEALSQPVPVNFRGQTFEIPPTSLWPYSALEAYEDGKVAAFLRALLGPEQHRRFRPLVATVGDAEAFVQVLQEALGISGN